MAWTFTTLKSAIQDYTENTETSFVSNMTNIIVQAENRIIKSVELPNFRKNQTGTFTTGNTYLATPTDYLYPYSLAVLDSDSNYNYLINKDVNFIREAYPNPATTGTPVHYANFSDTSLIVGPTPNSGFTVELHYGYYPESIVTASTTWLGNEFSSVLLNGSLIEAVRFMKGEPDIIANYEKLYLQSIGLLKNLGDGKLREDSYRAGQYRQAVS